MLRKDGRSCRYRCRARECGWLCHEQLVASQSDATVECARPAVGETAQSTRAEPATMPVAIHYEYAAVAALAKVVRLTRHRPLCSCFRHYRLRHPAKVKPDPLRRMT